MNCEYRLPHVSRKRKLAHASKNVGYVTDHGTLLNVHAALKTNHKTNRGMHHLHTAQLEHGRIRKHGKQTIPDLIQNLQKHKWSMELAIENTCHDWWRALESHAKKLFHCLQLGINRENLSNRAMQKTLETRCGETCAYVRTNVHSKCTNRLENTIRTILDKPKRP